MVQLRFCEDNYTEKKDETDATKRSNLYTLKRKTSTKFWKKDACSIGKNGDYTNSTGFM